MPDTWYLNYLAQLHRPTRASAAIASVIMNPDMHRATARHPAPAPCPVACIAPLPACGENSFLPNEPDKSLKTKDSFFKKHFPPHKNRGKLQENAGFLHGFEPRGALRRIPPHLH
jgi:hypothetical protein